MLAVHGYYDGTAFQPLEKMSVKLNQKVIITIIDDFVEAPKSAKEERIEKIKRLRGCLSKYARPDAMEQEEGAWARAAVKKHGNV